MTANRQGSLFFVEFQERTKCNPRQNNKWVLNFISLIILDYDAYIHINRIYWQKQNKTEMKLDWSVMIILPKVPLPALGHLFIGIKEFSRGDARYIATKFIVRPFLCYNIYRCFSGPLIYTVFHAFLLNVTNTTIGFNILEVVTSWIMCLKIYVEVLTLELYFFRIIAVVVG